MANDEQRDREAAEQRGHEEQPKSGSSYGQRAGDSRQQPWRGTETPDPRRSGNDAPASEVVPLEDGVHSGRRDGEPGGGEGSRASARRGETANHASGNADVRRPVDLVGAVPPEPRQPEDAGESLQTAPDPSLVREDVLNTSDSSGLNAEDEATGDAVKELYRKGARMISRMD